MSSYIPMEDALAAVKTGFDLIKGVGDLLKKDNLMRLRSISICSNSSSYYSKHEAL
jgi:hypothetical protein